MSAKTLVLLVAGLAGSAFGASAWAAETTAAPSVRVSYSDLDLSRDAGVERLYGRLRQAANHVCETGAGSRDLRVSALREACAKRALDGAVASVHSTRLSARHSLGVAASSVAMRD